MIARKILMSARAVSVNIASSVRNPDIRALALAAGWNGSGAITLKINSGVDVASLVIPATIPNGALTLINYGRIGGVINSGTGLTVRTNIVVINNGTIFGGGGKGGAGGAANVTYVGTTTSANGGVGGSGAGYPASGNVVLQSRTSGGSSNTVYYSGATTGARPWATGGAGGAGGDIGAAGSPGSPGSYGDGDGGRAYAYGPGSAAGNYIDGNAYVTWQPKGDVRGNAI